MIAPRIAPYRPSSVRVHLCPTLPDQLEEVELEVTLILTPTVTVTLTVT